MVDAGAFLVTAAGVLVVNAIAAVLAGCSLYALRFLYERYSRSRTPRNFDAELTPLSQ
jgi:hypothetical protein